MVSAPEQFIVPHTCHRYSETGLVTRCGGSSGQQSGHLTLQVAGGPFIVTAPGTSPPPAPAHAGPASRAWIQEEEPPEESVLFSEKSGAMRSIVEWAITVTH